MNLISEYQPYFQKICTPINKTERPNETITFGLNSSPV